MPSRLVLWLIPFSCLLSACAVFRSDSNAPVKDEQELVRRVDTIYLEQSTPSALAEHMDVLYAGVDNPILAEPGTQLSSDDVSIRANGIDRYILRPTAPGVVRITAANAQESRRLLFLVRRVPNPEIRLGTLRSSTLSVDTMRIQDSLTAKLINFPFEASCEVESFDLLYISTEGRTTVRNNAGSQFNEDSGALISTAQQKDIFIFENIRVSCPGDQESRNLGSRAYRVE